MAARAVTFSLRPRRLVDSAGEARFGENPSGVLEWSGGDESVGR